jgi:hypothetical protein
MALRPFFIVSSTASMISFLALHLTQYPSGIKNLLPDASCVMAVTQTSLWKGYPYRQAGKRRGATYNKAPLIVIYLIISVL